MEKKYAVWKRSPFSHFTSVNYDRRLTANLTLPEAEKIVANCNSEEKTDAYYVGE